MAYCTIDEVKLALGSKSQAQDDLLAALIPQAQARFDAEVGHSFQTITETRTFDGTGHNTLLVDRLETFTAVQIVPVYVSQSAGGALTRTTGTPQDITQGCYLKANQRILARYGDGYFPEGPQNIQVTGTWGYATVPDDVKRATIRLTIHFLKQKDASYQDQTGTDQYGHLVFKQQLPADVCQIIDHYRPRIFRMR